MFLLVGDAYMSEKHLRQPRSIYSARETFTKTKKEYKNLKEQEMIDIFVGMRQIKLFFSVIWLMVISKI